MKKVLITGINSYIGNACCEYLKQFNDTYLVQKISLRDGVPEWLDVRGYDCIFHVAGIAHADVSRVSAEEKARYYVVNCELTGKMAIRAKEQGVKQFIYMSSVIIYGKNAGVGMKEHITKDTCPSPANFYGDSKRLAEQKLMQLADEDFQIAIIRAPMVYGRNSKGNFPVLCKLANYCCVFPKVQNIRSMLYIENLTEFVKRLIDSGKGGIYFPQNKEYSNTSELVKMLRIEKGKRMHLSRILGGMVYLGARLPGRIGRQINKAFGSLTIDQALSNEDITGYQLYSLEESIRRIYEG